MINRAFPVELFPDDDAPGVGISANCWINAIGMSIVLWGLIFRALGVL